MLVYLLVRHWCYVTMCYAGVVTGKALVLFSVMHLYGSYLCWCRFTVTHPGCECVRHACNIAETELCKPRTTNSTLVKHAADQSHGQVAQQLS